MDFNIRVNFVYIWACVGILSLFHMTLFLEKDQDRSISGILVFCRYEPYTYMRLHVWVDMQYFYVKCQHLLWYVRVCSYSCVLWFNDSALSSSVNYLFYLFVFFFWNPKKPVQFLLYAGWVIFLMSVLLFVFLRTKSSKLIIMFLFCFCIYNY